jgi:mannose-6-phosphate isomerase-like protein (cupin superfamily)
MQLVTCRCAMAAWRRCGALLLAGLLVAACAGGPGRDAATGAGQRAPGPQAQGSAGPALPARGGQGAAPAAADPAAGDEDARAQAIAAILNEERATIHACWARAAADDFRLEGQVVLAVDIGAQGAAHEVRVVRDEPGDPRLTRCLVERFRARTWPAPFAAGDLLQLPPLVFAAPVAQYTVDSRDVEPIAVPGAGSARSEVSLLLHEQNTGNGAAALSLLRMSGGVEVPLHLHERTTEVVYLISGKGTMYGAAGRRKGIPLGPGDAVFVPPGTPHAFVAARGAEPAVLLQLYTPAGPEQRFRGVAGADIRPVSEPGPRAGRRSGQPVPVVRRGAEVPALPLPGGKGKVQILLDATSGGDGSASLGVLRAPADFSVPAHRHPGSSEYLYILQGSGTMTVDGEVYPVTPGLALQVPGNVEHSFRSSGDEPLVAIQVYTPGGPEQRFRQAP